MIDALRLQREAVVALLNDSGFAAVPCALAHADIESALLGPAPAAVVIALDSLDDGAALLLQLLREHGARALLLAVTRDAAVHARAMELGASGVVSLHEGGAVLCEAVRAVADGHIWLEHQSASAIAGYLARQRGIRDLETLKIASLTRRERDIVALVTEGMRNRQIADRLCISEATVRNHLTSILSKLNLTDRFDLAVYAFRRGIAKVMIDDPAPRRSHAIASR